MKILNENHLNHEKIGANCDHCPQKVTSGVKDFENISEIRSESEMKEIVR